jgi:hypothetical protein
VKDIQREVDLLTAAERQALTAWMVERYPLRFVEDLVSHAETEARQGKWTPTPPSAENIPTGQALAKAVQRAKALGITQ